MTGQRRGATVREVPRGGGSAGKAPFGPPPPPRATMTDSTGGNAALAGLRHAWATRPALRLVAAAALVVGGTALATGVTAPEFAILVGTATVAAVAEILRGAIEADAGRASGESRAHRAAASAMGAGAVAAAMVGAAVAAAAVIGGRVFDATR